ncbi:MAG: hypothetical protein V4739_15540 [Pseudomonadota bacterium]
MKLAVFILVGVFLAGCGGGGGDAQGSSGNSSLGLSVDQTALVFTGEEGQSTLVADQTVSGSITGATEPVVVKISYTDKGMLSAKFTRTSETSGQLQITPRQIKGLAPGVYQDTVTIEACYDNPCARPLPGSPRVVNVSYTVQAPRPAPVLKLSDRGVALASTPGGSRLSRTLTVRDTSGASSNWTARSDASWLTVTAAGPSGGPLVLTANPAGLPPGLRVATVTVSSSNSALEAQTVRVGLHTDTATPATSLVAPAPNSPWMGHAVDPVRPLVYSAEGSSIAVHHVYSGVRTATIAIPNAQLGAVVVNDDGSRLYAVNSADNRIVVVNLDTMSVSHSYGQFVNTSLLSSRMAFARVNGQAVLMLSNAEIIETYPMRRSLAPVFKAETGELVGELPLQVIGGNLRLAVSRDGTTVYGSEAGLSGYLSTTRVEMQANSLGNIYGKAVATTTRLLEASLQDLATSPDGSRVYLRYFSSPVVREAVYAGNALQWTAGIPDLAPPANTFGSSIPNLEVDATGRLITNDASFTLRVFSATGALEHQSQNVGNQTLASGGPGLILVSGDGLRLIGNGRLVGIPP